MVTVTYLMQDLHGEVQKHELQVQSNNIIDADDAAVKAGAIPFSKMYFKVSKCVKGK